jgi:hypothetical protein
MTKISMTAKEIEQRTWRILGDNSSSGTAFEARWKLLEIKAKEMSGLSAEEATIKLHEFITTFPEKRYRIAIDVTLLLFELLDIEPPGPKIGCFGFCITGSYDPKMYANALQEVMEKLGELKADTAEQGAFRPS